MYAGVPLEPLVFNAMVEPPSVPTTKHARQYATNVPPVRGSAAFLRTLPCQLGHLPACLMFYLSLVGRKLTTHL